MTTVPLAAAGCRPATTLAASAVFEIHERGGPAAAHDEGKCNAR